MRKILEACPTCGGPLVVSEIRCERCATEVRSRYQPCPFCRLTPEQMNFILLFVQTRGNLSEVEKALGVSYPTIRGKLEDIIRVLTASQPVAPAAPAAPIPPPSGQQPSAPGDSETARREILARVASGAMSAAEGLQALRRAARGESKS